MPVALVPNIVLFQSSTCAFRICSSENLNPFLGPFTFNKDSKVLTAFFMESIYRSSYFWKPNFCIWFFKLITSKYIWKSINSSVSDSALLLYNGSFSSISSSNEIGISSIYSLPTPHLYTISSQLILTIVIKVSVTIKENWCFII